MADIEQSNTSEGLMDELQECADILTEKLKSDDLGGVIEVVHALVEARDKSVFHEVGKLTRGLHNALVDFHIDAQVTEKDTNGLPVTIDDASVRLDHVIKMMEEAAIKTMDSVDEISPIAAQFSQEASTLKEDWGKLRRKELSPDEFRELYGRVDDFLDHAVNSSNHFGNHLQEIMLAQGFQDLTGQIIRRVINMVKDVETNLVDLVSRAGQIEKFVGIVAQVEDDVESGAQEVNQRHLEGEGPQVREHSDIVANQDDVDDLLSSLGF